MKLAPALGNLVRSLNPGYFAFSMATGIVAVACFLSGFFVVQHVLFGAALLGYLWLLLLTLARLILHPTKLLADFRDLSKGPAFFTTIAATAVIGSCFHRLYQLEQIGFVFWLFGVGMWLVLVYGFVLSTITVENKPPVEKAVNGSWLILVVATQALAILGSLLTEKLHAEWIFFVAASLFMLGCALYLLIISLVVVRLLFRSVHPEDLTPTYWVMMGAAAISALSGVELDRHAEAWTLQVQALPVLQGFTLFFWIAATGWLPLLALLGLWRHVTRRYPLAYEPQLWSVVFPLGMYSVATNSFATVFKLPFLAPLPLIFTLVSLAAWCACLVGLGRNVYRGLSPGIVQDEGARAVGELRNPVTETRVERI